MSSSSDGVGQAFRDPTGERGAVGGGTFLDDGASDFMFEQAMAQTRMAITLADPHREDCPLVFVNRAFCQLTGYDAKEVLGRNCRFLQGPGTDPREVKAVAEALKAEEVIVTEILNYRKDGTSFWNALHVGPIYSEETGELLYFFGSQWDVSEVHAARADEYHAKMLARELSHRMKNMFSVINAIVGMTGRSETDPRETAEKIQGRVMALGRAHEATLATASGTEPVDLSRMLATVLSPYDVADRIAFAGPEIRLDTSVVSMLALTLHELAINATKHGSLSASAGRVSLDWKTGRDEAEDEEILILTWTERGGPTLSETPDHKGLGGGIVDDLLTSAGGGISYDWKPEGLAATIHMALPTA